jgi:serine phosphatase RsbU (regulator of sigma subunit)
MTLILRYFFLLLLIFFAEYGYSNTLISKDIISGNSIENSLLQYKFIANSINEIDTTSKDNFEIFSWEKIPDNSSSSWIILTINNLNESEKKLVLGNNQFQYLEFYELKDDGQYKINLSGTLCSYSLMEEVFGANSWFVFNLPSNKVSTFYIRASNKEKVKYQYSKLPFTLYYYSDYKVYKSRQQFFNYFFWGALLIITLYNLFLYFQIRSKIYLYYVFNNFVILIFVLSQTGAISELFLSNSRLHEHLLLIFGNIAFIFYVLFCKEFLDFKTTQPTLNRILNKILWVWPLPLILIYFNQSEIAVSIGGLIAIWAYTRIMISAYKSIKSEDLGNKFFFIANIFYYSGTIVSILQIANVLPYQFLGLSSVNYVQLGTLLQIGLFSLTVGFKIVGMQREITEEKLVQERIKTDEEQKRRKIIEEQNKILEVKVSERTSELEKANQELIKQSEILELQKNVIEDKQKEIIDSLNYAKRIQYALLAHHTLLENRFKDFFILFKPKDIVSGDFYWATLNDDYFYLAICDCTGHGVPGAFMSLLNISFLNEAIIEKNLIKPNDILNHVRLMLEKNISQDGAKDGMDGTLICFNINNPYKISYASSYNRPILIRNKEIIELNTENMPIGKGEIIKSFQEFELILNEGDNLYFYTDGFPDQFGGPKGKKFKYKQLNELLLDISSRPCINQKEILENTFLEWKKNTEQIDDVCIVGIQF